MSERIRLVQGDTRPTVIANLRDADGDPVDLVGSTVRLRFRAAGATSLTDTIVGTLAAGFERDDGTVTTASPYDVAGFGGRVEFAWGAETLAEPGYYEGEIEITFGDDTVQTVFDVVKFKVRSQF